MTQDYTLSDIAAVTGGGGKNDGIFGGNGNGAWFLIILFLFAFMGWGGGWGGRSAGGSGYDGGVMNNYVLTSDFAQVERKLDGIANGICDSTFALNNTINTGFAAAQQTMTQGFAGLNTGMVQQGYETRIGINGIGQQMSQCCCDLKGGIADLKYTVAQGDNSVANAIGFASRDIIDNANANYRALHDEIVANRIEDKNNRIAELQQQVFSQQLAASQCAQNAYLVDKLGPHCPQAAYVVQPPQNVSFPLGCNGVVAYNGGCGCGA